MFIGCKLGLAVIRFHIFRPNLLAERHFVDTIQKPTCQQIIELTTKIQGQLCRSNIVSAKGRAKGFRLLVVEPYTSSLFQNMSISATTCDRSQGLIFTSYFTVNFYHFKLASALIKHQTPIRWHLRDSAAFYKVPRHSA